ncbi:hypothetical protein GCM10010912_07110 [Paenibacillus albidus]|uniref:Uncharacterized protein n=1 Tax=Paenibacillus albidus TaxID=2041023 RepID=A0A917FC05_9BACL|nr:hypothetical protein [Paenibacillus albidus]GGF64718.1 hypothetical protein GCM10010912_07110 [Paenibacillus albidus]
MVQKQKRPKTVALLYVLHVFLGLGAIAGGLVLIVDPSGQMIGMDTSILVKSPFANFAIPGLLLLLVFGLLPLGVLYSMIKRPCWKWAERVNPFEGLHSSWALSLYIGFGLIIWIMVQTYMMNTAVFIHVFYMSLGLLIQAVTLLPAVQRYFVLDDSNQRS